MMISKKMQDAINNQIQAELYSAHLYLAMSVYAQSKGLNGFGQWLYVQYQEETFHAMKLLRYLVERGGNVVLMAIEAPPAEFGTPKEMFEKVLAHEQHVTSLINNLYEVAITERDFAAQIFLQWYVNEQVEEEASVSEVIEKISLIGEGTPSILYLDKELGMRTFVPPAEENQQ